MNGRYFRAGAGTVIYNNEGQVAWFERSYHPVGVWQFQQGGLDAGEAPEVAMWRELREEVGVRPEAFTVVTPYPHWTLYEYDPGNPEPDRLGQAHRWWFLKLKPDLTIDLAQASDQEFSNWKWTTFDEALAETNDLKRRVYQELYDFFKHHLC